MADLNRQSAPGGLMAGIVDAAFNLHDSFKKCFYAHRWLQIILLALSMAFFAWALYDSGTLPL